VDACHPGLPVPVLAAFADATYNMGPTIACDPTRSTAARLLRAKDFAGACRQLPRWNKARVAGVIVELPGLTKRRAEEMRVCLEGV
jgi:GH24 family phage-related lysozyme (muramidase)